MRTADPVKDPSAEMDDLRVPGCAIAATTKRAESAIRSVSLVVGIVAVSDGRDIA
jgi:hypothetical protein